MSLIPRHRAILHHRGMHQAPKGERRQYQAAAPGSEQASTRPAPAPDHAPEPPAAVTRGGYTGPAPVAWVMSTITASDGSRHRVRTPLSGPVRFAGTRRDETGQLVAGIVLGTGAGGPWFLEYADPGLFAALAGAALVSRDAVRGDVLPRRRPAADPGETEQAHGGVGAGQEADGEPAGESVTAEQSVEDALAFAMRAVLIDWPYEHEKALWDAYSALREAGELYDAIAHGLVSWEVHYPGLDRECEDPQAEAADRLAAEVREMASVLADLLAEALGDEAAAQAVTGAAESTDAPAESDASDASAALLAKGAA